VQIVGDLGNWMLGRGLNRRAPIECNAASRSQDGAETAQVDALRAEVDRLEKLRRQSTLRPVGGP
jgi:hypothetical protein